MTLPTFDPSDSGEQFTRKTSAGYVVCASLLAAGMASKGMGSTTIYQMLVAAMAALCAWRSLAYKQKGYAALCIIAGIGMVLVTSFSHFAWIFIVMILGLSRNIRDVNKLESRGYDALALGIGLMWCAARFSPWTAWITPFAALILPAAFTVVLWPFNKFRSLTWLAVLLIAAAFLIKDILAAADTKLITIESYDVPNVTVFPHGKVIARLTGATLVPKGETRGDVGIVNMIFGATPNKSSHPTYLVEHDIGPSAQHSVLEGKNLHQQQPWEYNQMFGDEYLLAAIARDGYWASNLGGGLKREGRVMLGSLRHSGGLSYEPIVVRTNDYTYIQDSDPFVDWLANGQRTVIKELTQGVMDFRYFNLAAVLLASLLILAPGWSRIFLTLLICTASTIHAVSEYRVVSGDILFVGRDGGPHELSRSAGVTRSIIESGRPVVESNRPSPIVVVARGESYRITGVEKLIILAPNSQVHLAEGSVKANDTPLGVVDGITDARLLHHPGGISKGVLELKGMVFIATDAPAKLNWDKWFPRS